MSDANQKLRFLMVGGWNTVAGYFIFLLLDVILANILSIRYVAYISAMVASQAISITQAFFLHKYFTFRSKTRGRQLVGEFLRFVTTYLGICIAAPVMLTVLVEIVHIPPRVSAGIITLLLAIAGYFGHGRFSFRGVK